MTVTAERHIGLSTPLPKYSGFPWWHALIVTSGHERSTAERLQRFDVHAYLPTYTKRVHQRCRNTEVRLYPIITGMLFVPTEMMDVRRRDELFELCGVADYMRDETREPRRIGKTVIEEIRELEARENMPAKAVRHNFRVGQKVKFTNRLLCAFWCESNPAVVVGLLSAGRISIEVPQLFGRKTRIVVLPSEIVAM